jgi:hypothetical protein
VDRGRTRCEASGLVVEEYAASTRRGPVQRRLSSAVSSYVYRRRAFGHRIRLKQGGSVESLIGVTILGITFSGTQALIAAIVIVLLVGAGWYVLRRRS